MSDEKSVATNSSKNLFVQLLEVVLSKGKKEIKHFASDGRRRLDLRSLQKDRMKMYEKLGREVECLIEAGEISHPGLCRGVDRIHQLDEQIKVLKQKTREELQKSTPANSEE